MNKLTYPAVEFNTIELRVFTFCFLLPDNPDQQIFAVASIDLHTALIAFEQNYCFATIVSVSEVNKCLCCYP